MLGWPQERIDVELVSNGGAFGGKEDMSIQAQTALAAVEDEGADLACAKSRGRSHPVFGLWPLRLRDDLHQAVVAEELRKVDHWTGRYKLIEVEFEDIDSPAGPLDPFFNTNSPEDLEEAARYLAG